MFRFILALACGLTNHIGGNKREILDPLQKKSTRRRRRVNAKIQYGAKVIIHRYKNLKQNVIVAFCYRVVFYVLIITSSSSSVVKKRRRIWQEKNNQPTNSGFPGRDSIVGLVHLILLSGDPGSNPGNGNGNNVVVFFCGRFIIIIDKSCKLTTTPWRNWLTRLTPDQKACVFHNVFLFFFNSRIKFNVPSLNKWIGSFKKRKCVSTTEKSHYQKWKVVFV